jgi:hypothetical protein
MADDPNKRHQDSFTVSWQSHEIEYVKGVVRRDFPAKTDRQIADAIEQCKRQIQPSEGREKLMACIRQKLR